MATVTLTNTPIIIDNAESTSNWGGDSFSLDPDVKVQGSNSVSCAQTNNGSNDVYVSGTWDFSSEVHLRLWINLAYIPQIATKANNGIQIFLYDGSNTAYYTIDGSDTYSGGWKQLVLYTGNTPTSGSVTKSSITRIGVRVNTTSKPRNLTNAWYDMWAYGDGYTVTGGTSGDEINWSSIASVDSNSAYGIVNEVDGVIFVSGRINIGNGPTTTYFKDEGEIVVYKDLLVNSTLYGIIFQGSSCNVSIDGGVYACAGSQDFRFDADDTDLNSFSMTGKQIVSASNAFFKSGQSITNCVFDNCGQVEPSTSTFTYNILRNSTDTGGALLWPSDDSNISDLTFINCDNGVEYDSTSDTSSPTFDNIVFDDVSGNYDVNNTSGGSITILLTGTSNANSYNTSNSSVTFSSSITLKMIVKDESGTEISGAYAYIDDNDSSPYIMNTTTDSNGEASTGYSGSSVSNSRWRVRKYGYKQFKALIDIGSSDITLPVTLVADPQQT